MSRGQRTADVIIIGAGIVGAACARECARQGLSALVIEPRAPGGGATAAAMGHLLVVDALDPADRHEYALSHRSQQLWRQWLDAHPDAAAEVEHQRCGTLWVAADEEELQLAQRKAQWMSAQGLSAELLDPQALREAEPLLRAGLAGGLRVADDARLYPPKVVARWLKESGAALLRAEVQTLEPGGGVRLTDGRRLWGAAVWLCAGLHSQRFLPPGLLLAKKGQLAVTQAEPDLPPLRHQLVELGYLKKAHLVDQDSVSFNVQPRPGGQWLIGSSRQPGRADDLLDLPLLRQMLACARGYLPTLSRMSLLRSWTGLRPASADGVPLIGAHPCLSRCWVAAGHEGLGITTSLASAELLAQCCLGQTPLLDAKIYEPARFLDKPMTEHAA